MNNLEDTQNKRFSGKRSIDYELTIQCTPGYMELETLMAKKIAEKYFIPRVMDIGVGTGITTQQILNYNPGARVFGVDSEPQMIEQAKSNLRDEINHCNVQLFETDALDFLDSLVNEQGNRTFFKVVASAYTLHNCSNEYRNEVVNRIFRVLEPGGMFINCDKYAVDDPREYFRALAGQLSRYKLLTDEGRADLQFEWTKHEIEDQNPIRIMHVGKAIEQLENAGFKKIGIIERIEQYAILTAYKPDLFS